jgi:hypothetical protein
MATLQTSFTVSDQDNVDFYIEVSPCSWKSPNYGTQVKVSLKPNPVNAEAEFLKWDTPWEKVSEQEILDHVAKFIQAGGKETLKKAEAAWAKARASFDKIYTELDKKEAKKNAEMKKAGFTHLVEAIVHPRTGGSDRFIAFYCKRVPSATEMQAKLKKLGSSILNDYSIKAL